MLYRAFPKLFIPLYSLVTFTNTPYHLAVQRAHKQDGWIRTVSLTVLSACTAAFGYVLVRYKASLIGFGKSLTF